MIKSQTEFQAPAPEVSNRPEVLEAETALARARVGADLEDIRAKLTPAGLAQEVQTHLQARVQRSASVRAPLERGAGRGRVSSSGAALTTLLGAGLAWLLLRSRKRREGR